MKSTEKAQQELERVERQVALLEGSASQNDDTRRQLAKLQERITTLQQEMKGPQTAWQKTELARHPQRPQTLDYIERLFTDFSEIHGDRSFGDDAAIICGMARFHGEEILIVGTQKGRDMKQRVHRNFGTPHPEGYRKALRVMQVAEKFRRPILTLVDTDGAYPGIHAEERGQRHHIDGEHDTRLEGVGARHQQWARDQRDREGDEVEPPAQHGAGGFGWRRAQRGLRLEVSGNDARERSENRPGAYTPRSAMRSGCGARPGGGAKPAGTRRRGRRSSRGRDCTSGTTPPACGARAISGRASEGRRRASARSGSDAVPLATNHCFD